MVTIYDRRPDTAGMSRRDLFRKAGGAAIVFVISGHTLISPRNAWGMETKALKPDTMATLIQLGRDIYPHDHVPDRFYAIAMKGYDDPAKAEMVEAGVADLDTRAGKDGYRGLGWEEERVAILREIEESAFFQTVRGGMVTGLYNQKEVWPLFGYEGESYSKGGYMDRGFNDIEWL